MSNPMIEQIQVGGVSYDIVDATARTTLSSIDSRVTSLEDSVVASVTKSGSTITVTKKNGTINTFTDTDTNTTYSAGKNISLSGTSFSLALNRTTMTLTTSGGGNVNTNISCTNRVIIAAYSTTGDSYVCLPYRGYAASNTWGIHVIRDNDNAVVGSTSIAFVIYYLVV